MAALGQRELRAEASLKQTKSALVSPNKVRDLLNQGLASEEHRVPGGPRGDTELLAACEAENRDAFFSRVASFSCLRWAGKPRALSPLRCAKFGWVSVDCDVLKCSSCQAFLCASIQPGLDFHRYEARVKELTVQLRAQHEKFCSWSDFPCPDRFWMVPVGEPLVLLSGFVDRFQSVCVLEQQLPAMKAEQLTAMSLTEDAVSVLLQLIEEEQKKLGQTPQKPSSELLSVQVAACVVALCGWSANSSELQALHLPSLTCSYCMRKVGLWNFHQMEGTGSEVDVAVAADVAPDGRGGDRSTPPSPSLTPCRMKLRSQDSTRSHGGEQVEGTPSALVVRTRSMDSPSPVEDLPRGKRPMTRSRGQGEGGAAAGGEPQSSPQRRPKRPRLSSSSCSDTPLHRNTFDPVAQHRDWCPWVSVEEDKDAGVVGAVRLGSEAELPLPGWRAVLAHFLSTKRSLSPVGASPSQGPHDKSKRVFQILRQWQAHAPSQ
ncbi:zinc finger C3HC-type protein 1 isoform X2 [Denticeps clupeoides]|uniref:zinc finger C3HC-type protein 1 isoform X2 n=1 Tax=Denticeps clupeoides TaxID=299321 RepID=UPI0010A4BBD6|nr:nuclear-interacting partner of ALK isoform X2 [Denticeps clupeoides]